MTYAVPTGVRPTMQHAKDMDDGYRVGLILYNIQMPRNIDNIQHILFH